MHSNSLQESILRKSIQNLEFLNSFALRKRNRKIFLTDFLFCKSGPVQTPYTPAGGGPDRESESPALLQLGPESRMGTRNFNIYCSQCGGGLHSGSGRVRAISNMPSVCSGAGCCAVGTVCIGSVCRRMGSGLSKRSDLQRVS